jgi:hypothetical protein
MTRLQLLPKQHEQYAATIIQLKNKNHNLTVNNRDLECIVARLYDIAAPHISKGNYLHQRVKFYLQ